MYRLLIVDDEPHVVDWLYELFKNLRYAEFDVYKAYSATSALQWMKRTKIDIAITDINMPKMSGLQLAECIKAEWPECKVIFLTGFNEFEYAHKAIENDVMGYVLKNEDDGELLKVVEKAVQQIEDGRRLEEVRNRAKQQIKAAQMLLQREFLTEILEGRYTNPDEIEKQLEELEIPINPDYPLFLLFGRMDNKAETGSYIERRELFYGIEEVCNRFLSSSVSSFLHIRDSYDMVWFIQPKKIESTADARQHHEMLEKTALFVRDTLETIQAACRKTLGTSVSFVLGMEPVTWATVNQKYFELKNLMHCNVGMGSEMLMTDKSFRAIESQAIAADGISNNLQLKASKLGTLGIYLEKRQKDEFHLLLDEIGGCLRNVKSTNSNPALELYYSLSVLFLSYINRKGLATKLAFKTGLNKLVRIEEHSSWSEALDYLHNLADIIFAIQEEKEDNVVSDTVSIVMGYIKSHLNEDLSLVKLADTVYFNPSYLSRLFKQVTGYNLTDYISEIKANKAKELLEDMGLKIHEVASAVGFDSSTYFAKFFKKMTGINPQEYRDSILKR